MKIIINCDTLKELKEAVDMIHVIFPEKEKKTQKAPAMMEAQQAAGAEKTGKKEASKVSADDVRKLHEYGMKPEQIAKELGCSKATVYNKLKE